MILTINKSIYKKYCNMIYPNTIYPTKYIIYQHMKDDWLEFMATWYQESLSNIQI